MLTKLTRRFYLFMYKVMGFGFLATIPTVILTAFFLMMFFFFSATWIAPTILSPTSDRMLAFSAGYQQSFQNIETLRVTASQAERDLKAAKENSKLLHMLSDQMAGYVGKTEQLGNRKKNDLVDTFTLLNDLDKVKVETQKSVEAGIITKNDATQALTSIQQFRNVATDSNQAYHTLSITVQIQIVQLLAQVVQADNDVHTKAETSAAAIKSVNVALAGMQRLLDSSYYRAYTNDGANLAFIPYDNIKAAKIGNPIYDCYLMIVACRQVGIISAVYKDEQIVDFPIFNVRFSRTMRGVFIEMNMTKPESMRSLIVFAGSKPLFF